MKISQFKGNGISKKLQFGEYINVLENENLRGEINFYDIDVAKLAKINKDVILKLNITDTNELFMYELISEISDVEVDVTFEEFTDMLNCSNAKFTAFMNEVVLAIGEIFTLLDNLQKSKSNSETVTKSITDKVGAVETFEENMRVIVENENNLNVEKVLEDLYEKLSSAKNKEEKKELINQISVLEME